MSNLRDISCFPAASASYDHGTQLPEFSHRLYANGNETTLAPRLDSDVPPPTIIESKVFRWSHPQLRGFVPSDSCARPRSVTDSEQSPVMRAQNACRIAAIILLLAPGAWPQIIEFESKGLHYQAQTKNGITVMFATLPAHIKDFNIIQITITNGSPLSWTVKPEDFSFIRQDGTHLASVSADGVVESLLQRASRNDVIKLQLLYENTIYALTNFRSTNGYEKRRQTAMGMFVNPRFKAAAEASAIAFAQTKLKPSESTDGAVFFESKEKVLGQGRLMVHTAGEEFEFDTFPEVKLK